VDWLVSALVSFVLTIIVGLIAYRRLKSAIWETINDFSVQFSEKLSEVLGEAINPIVKKGFSLAGSLGGSAKAKKELSNELAKSFINKNYGSIKMLAENVLDMDVDDIIDRYGASTVMNTIQDFLPMLQGKGGGGGGLSGLLSGLGSRQKGHNSESNQVPEM